MGSPSRRLVLDGLLVALGLAVHQAEAAIPPLLPGVKPGLANVFGLVAFVALGWRDAAAVTLLRVFLGGLFSGLGLAFLCSLGGSLAALAALILLGRFVPDRLSLEGLSVAQAGAFNLAQLLVVALLLGSWGVALPYAPLLATSALVTGLGTGLLARMLLRHPFLATSPLPGGSCETERRQP